MVNTMNEKFESFKRDLIQLCNKHGVTLSTSGYDYIEVWDLDRDLGEIHADDLIDRTNGDEAR